ncbi:hypothetical protein IFM89_002006 [Coptis chinensis]|uniref:BZIP domain-containing protein n=1 Tax=Coptis chinensis TaxID=261450 RepID=A0A835HHW1_9MAGN|nr:hypothetical protein IFM89_002006 [Coptis chinensis]
MGEGSNGSGRPPGDISLTRQPSIYSLTFEEFQNSMGGFGKDFGSMNMDEFLKNVWTAEETQVTGTGFGGVPEGGGVPVGGNLQRQGSLTLPRTISTKTVDEVWKELFKENNEIVNGGSNLPQRQQTLGEMTLEEFLYRAGVVREEAQVVAAQQQNNGGFFGDLLPNNNNPGTRGTIMGIANPTMTSGLAQGGGLQGGVMGMAGLGGGAVTVASGSPANQLSDGLGKSNGDLSSVSPVPYAFNGGLRGKRSSGTVEKVVERRQRRMIKNRESAARSRARAQLALYKVADLSRFQNLHSFSIVRPKSRTAYTMELEAELAKLREQNEELQKKQVEMIEMQKSKVLEMMNQQKIPKKQCLRRTQTGPW